MGGLCGRYGVEQNVYRVSVIKPEKKNTLGRQGRRREDNVKMCL